MVSIDVRRPQHEIARAGAIADSPRRIDSITKGDFRIRRLAYPLLRHHPVIAGV